MNYRLCAFADEADQLLTGQIAALQRNGVSLLEIRGVDGENISVLSPAKVQEVAHLLQENGLVDTLREAGYTVEQIAYK